MPPTGVSQQDSLVLRQVAHLRREVQQRQRELQHAHGEQVQVVAEREAAALLDPEPARPAPGAARLHSRRDRESSGAGARAAGRAAAPPGSSGASPAGLGERHGARTDGATASPRRRSRPPSALRRRRRDRDALPRHALRVGRRLAWRFRLLGFVMYVFSQIGVSLPHNAAAQYGYGAPGLAGSAPAGRSRLLRRARSRRHLRRRRQLHPCAAHGRRGQVSSLSGWYSSTFVGARRL